jgi:L-ascorbate metabolism protein UlaG (beta-lactamase superfamily)
MRANKLFLRSDVQVEPLVGFWRAWPHLIFPPTYALNLRSKILPSLERALATTDQGGDDRKGVRGFNRQELEFILARALDEGARYLALATELTDFMQALARDAKGQPLAPFYEMLPRGLRGKVELYYDTAHSANMRFIGGLAYSPQLYCPQLQRVSVKRLMGHSDRRNLQSPRIEGGGQLILSCTFEGEQLKGLLRARQAPVSRSELHDLFGGGREADSIDCLLTETQDQPAPFHRADPPPFRLQYLGHACVLLQSRHSSILVDPLISYQQPGAQDQLTFRDLPARLDCVLITHGHLDHFDVETLLQLRDRTELVVVPPATNTLIDPSLRDLLLRLGFKNVRQLEELEELRVEDALVTAVPFLGEHSDLNVRAKSAYAVRMAGKTTLLLADSLNTSPDYWAMLSEHLGPVDYLFIGMESEGSDMSLANGPYFPIALDAEHDQARRTRANDFAEACAVVEALRPAAVYVYALGLEPWLWFMFGVPDPTKTKSLDGARRMVQYCTERGIAAKCLGINHAGGAGCER